MEWKQFPETAPMDGRPIVIGGYTKSISEQRAGIPLMHPGQWVTLTVSYGRFYAQPWLVCQTTSAKDTEDKWIILGFQTIDGYNVDWSVWHDILEAPAPPALLEE